MLIVIKLCKSLKNFIWYLAYSTFNFIYTYIYNNRVKISIIFLFLIILVPLSIFRYKKNHKIKLKWIWKRYKYYILGFIDFTLIMFLIVLLFQQLINALNTVIFGLTVSAISSVGIDKYVSLKQKLQNQTLNSINEFLTLSHNFNNFHKKIRDLIRNLPKVQNHLSYNNSNNKISKNYEKSLCDDFKSLLRFKTKSKEILNFISQIKIYVKNNIPEYIINTNNAENDKIKSLKETILDNLKHITDYTQRIIGIRGTSYKFYSHEYNKINNKNNNYINDIYSRIKDIFHKNPNIDENLRVSYSNNSIYEDINNFIELLKIISIDTGRESDTSFKVAKEITKFKNML